MRRSTIPILAVLAILWVAGPAAASQVYRMGDAQSVLRSYPASGGIHFPPAEARGLDIRPFPDYFADIDYCVEDWHVLALEWEAGAFRAPDGTVRTHQETVAYLNDVQMNFILDDIEVAALRMPIQPNQTDWALEQVMADLTAQYGEGVVVDGIWGFQMGRVLSPTDLAPGVHRFSVVVTEGSQTVLFDQGVTFTVSSADSEGCR